MDRSVVDSSGFFARECRDRNATELIHVKKTSQIYWVDADPALSDPEQSDVLAVLSRTSATPVFGLAPLFSVYLLLSSEENCVRKVG